MQTPLREEDKETLKNLRLLKESSSVVLVCLFDEVVQKEMGFNDSYYVSDESDMEPDLLKAKYFESDEVAYAFKSGLNIKAVPLSVLAQFEIEKIKNK